MSSPTINTNHILIQNVFNKISPKMVQFPPNYAIFGLNLIVGYLSDTIVRVGSDTNMYLTMKCRIRIAQK